MWLHKLKIAIVEKDVDTLSSLVENIQKFDDVKEMKEALYLTQEAVKLLLVLQDETHSSMKQIKKNLSFLHATQEVKSSKLDITS